MTAGTFLAGALLAAVAWSTPALAADFKVPPTPDHHVTDSAGALSSDAQSKIENELQAYETATGHQVIVYIADTTGDVPLETWTGDTAHQWRIGRRGHDDGAILFLFMKDHKVRIEVGYGLESSLTDADSSRIIQNDIVPRMKSQDTDGAVSAGVAAMLKTITPSYSGVSAPAESSGAEVPQSVGYGIAAVIVLIFGFIIFMIVMRVVGMIRYGYLVMREGKTKAKQDMKSFLLWNTTGAVIGSGSSFGGGSDFGGGGFSAGGGDFGGGGASGGW